jgi:plasmid stability protein
VWAVVRKSREDLDALRRTGVGALGGGAGLEEFEQGGAVFEVTGEGGSPLSRGCLRHVGSVTDQGDPWPWLGCCKVHAYCIRNVLLEGLTMPSLQIRQMPMNVYNALAFRAALAHRSLTQQTLVELSAAVGCDGKQRRMQVLQKIKDRQAQQHLPAALPDLADLVRQDRER